MNIPFDMIIIRLAESLGRMRALTDDESRTLEAALRRQYPSKPMRKWTEQEKAVLYQNAGKLSAAQIAGLLHNRSLPAIYVKMNNLGLSNRPKCEREQQCG